MKVNRLLRSLALLSLFAASIGAAPLRLEYVAHACFVVESPAGVRVVIDPYNSHRWLGYAFPAGLTADLVLVTHPHYDHNASYYVEGNPLTLRDPGRTEIGDVEVLGIEGRHAEPYGEEFGKSNTIWVVAAGGVRIAHLGDNGPLGEREVRELGRVDVLLLPADGQDHILKRAEAEQVLEQLAPRLAIPMHYRLALLTELPRTLGPIDPWLEGRPVVRRHQSHRLELTTELLATPPAVVVLEPSPAVEAWPQVFVEATAKRDQARAGFAEDPQAAVDLAREAVRLYPVSLDLWWSLANLLLQRGSGTEALTVLEQGLARAARDDRYTTYDVRLFVARIYERLGEARLAAEQARLVLAESRFLEQRRTAEELLARLQ